MSEPEFGLIIRKQNAGDRIKKKEVRRQCCGAGVYRIRRQSGTYRYIVIVAVQAQTLAVAILPTEPLINIDFFDFADFISRKGAKEN